MIIWDRIFTLIDNTQLKVWHILYLYKEDLLSKKYIVESLTRYEDLSHTLEDWGDL